VIGQPNQPRPVFFMSRNNGFLVPLVPADELPFNVRLQGVPRVLQWEQTYGMQHVGSAPYTGLTFQLVNDIGVQHDGSQTPTSTYGHYRSQPRTSIQPAAINETQSIIDAICSSAAGAAEAARLGYVPKAEPPSLPSGCPPDQDKKKYCTYWIRNGECDYTQQGCLYRHEMPDKETLENIGFRTVPRWWLEKQQRVIKIGGVGGEIAGVNQNASTNTEAPIMTGLEWTEKKSIGNGDTSERDTNSTRTGSESGISTGTFSSANMVHRGLAKAMSTSYGASKPTKPVKPGKPKEIKVPAFKAESNPTPPSSPAGLRTTSTTGDRIDLAMHLISSPPCSSTRSRSTNSSAQSSPSVSSTPSKQPLGEFCPTSTKAPTKIANSNSRNTKIFVPIGEPTEPHITEVTETTRNQNDQTRRQYTKRSTAVSTIGCVKSLEQQFQEMLKAKISEAGKEQELRLIASRHASGDEENKKDKRSVPRRSAKTGRRICHSAAVAPI